MLSKTGAPGASVSSTKQIEHITNSNESESEAAKARAQRSERRTKLLTIGRPPLGKHPDVHKYLDGDDPPDVQKVSRWCIDNVQSLLLIQLAEDFKSLPVTVTVGEKMGDTLVQEVLEEAKVPHGAVYWTNVTDDLALLKNVDCLKSLSANLNSKHRPNLVSTFCDVLKKAPLEKVKLFANILEHQLQEIFDSLMPLPLTTLEFGDLITDGEAKPDSLTQLLRMDSLSDISFFFRNKHHYEECSRFVVTALKNLAPSQTPKCFTLTSVRSFAAESLLTACYQPNSRLLMTVCGDGFSHLKFKIDELSERWESVEIHYVADEYAPSGMDAPQEFYDLVDKIRSVYRQTRWLSAMTGGLWQGVVFNEFVQASRPLNVNVRDLVVHTGLDAKDLTRLKRVNFTVFSKAREEEREQLAEHYKKLVFEEGVDPKLARKEIQKYFHTGTKDTGEVSSGELPSWLARDEFFDIDEKLVTAENFGQVLRFLSQGRHTEHITLSFGKLDDAKVLWLLAALGRMGMLKSAQLTNFSLNGMQVAVLPPDRLKVGEIVFMRGKEVGDDALALLSEMAQGGLNAELHAFLESWGIPQPSLLGPQPVTVVVEEKNFDEVLASLKEKKAVELLSLTVASVLQPKQLEQLLEVAGNQSVFKSLHLTMRVSGLRRSKVNVLSSVKNLDQLKFGKAVFVRGKPVEATDADAIDLLKSLMSMSTLKEPVENLLKSMGIQRPELPAGEPGTTANAKASKSPIEVTATADTPLHVPVGNQAGNVAAPAVVTTTINTDNFNTTLASLKQGVHTQILDLTADNLKPEQVGELLKALQGMPSLESLQLGLDGIHLNGEMIDALSKLKVLKGLTVQGRVFAYGEQPLNDLALDMVLSLVDQTMEAEVRELLKLLNIKWPETQAAMRQRARGYIASGQTKALLTLLPWISDSINVSAGTMMAGTPLEELLKFSEVAGKVTFDPPKQGMFDKLQSSIANLTTTRQARGQSVQAKPATSFWQKFVPGSQQPPQQQQPTRNRTTSTSATTLTQQTEKPPEKKDDSDPKKK